MTILVVDNREHSVWEALNEYESIDGVELQKKQLLIGDFSIEHGDRRIVIERKAWSDHCASIADGRRKEQQARAFAAREADPNMTYVIIIEGWVQSFEGKTGPVQHKSAYAALFKTAIRDGVPVLHTRDQASTAAALFYIAQAHGKGGFDPTSKAAERIASGYAGVAKFASKKANTEEAQWACMLASIPGVSGAKAKSIAEAFPNARSLVDYIAAGHGSKLADIPCASGRLGPALAKKLVANFS